jgi:kynurenine formamidase
MALKSARPRNWGRWGSADERGTLNFIGHDQVRAAAGTVTRGQTYNLGLPIQRDGVPVYEHRGVPRRFTLTSQTDTEIFTPYGGPPGLGANEDVLVVAAHNGTHMDALCHVFNENRFYNDIPTAVVNSDRGAQRLGIEKTGGFAGRMVLLDVAAHRGVDWLDPGTPITRADLEECSAAQQSTVSEGDILLVRTGWLDFFASLEGTAPPFEQPGIDLSAASFIYDHKVAAVGADNGGVEVIPFDDNRFLSVHIELLVNQGVTLLEHLWLRELAVDKVYQGLIIVAPLLVTGGSGSPINPIVIA